MNDMMKEALAKRKGKGVAVEIAIGKPESKTDMAPSSDSESAIEDTEMSDLQKLSELVKDNPEASALVAKMMGSQEEEMKEEGSEDEMTSSMSDYDKKDVMDREKPRSLMERAQKEALMKGTK